MFVSEAHSATQQSRLAITLAWIAGYTNAVTLLSCHTATSHVSGTTSNFGIEVASQHWTLAGYSLFLILTFVFGAALSGATTELGRRAHWESIYVLPMALQGLLLTAFSLCIEFIPSAELRGGNTIFLATGLASLAMGLQNATITRISHGIVRTTHVTGVLTDLGLETVQFLAIQYDKTRGRVPSLHVASPPTGERLLLLASIVGSFAFGAALGTTGYEGFSTLAMFPPVLFLAWIILVDVRKPIAEITASKIALDSGLTECAVFRMTPDRRRRGQHQRMPNLSVWSSMLVPAVKTVILDLSEIVSIADNSLEELRKLAQQFASQGRVLMVAGYRERPNNLSSQPAFYPDVQSAVRAAKS